MKALKAYLVLAAAAGPLAVAPAAQASVIDLVTMTFQSGATFTGTVTFANDYSSVLAVTGTLTGYQFGSYGNVGGGATDSINWVWADGQNYSTGAGNYSTFLMDGPGSGYANTDSYSNWIQLSYNYNTAPALSFTSGVSVYGTDNYLDYNDPLVSGSIGADDFKDSLRGAIISSPGPVPGAGLAGLAALALAALYSSTRRG